MADTDSGTDKPTTISKHKTGLSRRTASPDKPGGTGGPQAFDIVPRSQVRPEATSRPVITGNQPPVADNTLLKPAGVSVSDLIAKRSKHVDTPPADDTSADDAPVDGYFLDSDKAAATPAVEAEKPAVSAETVKTVETGDTAQSVAAVSPSEQPSKQPADGTIEQALYEDQSKPQEHSESLKNAITELEQSDDSQHHELYGGKPVIIVHGSRGSGVGQLLLVLLCLLLVALAADLMLDAGIISNSYDIPHTDILQ